MRIELEHVRYMPKELKPGVLYVSEEFGAAAHLCPCGCGLKVRTPLGPTDWSLSEASRGPTLFPSIGNWQQPCRSHYWICDGEITWADDWTPEEVSVGRRTEDAQSRAHYDRAEQSRHRWLQKFWAWGKHVFKRERRG